MMRTQAVLPAVFILFFNFSAAAQTFSPSASSSNSSNSNSGNSNDQQSQPEIMLTLPPGLDQFNGSAKVDKLVPAFKTVSEAASGFSTSGVV